MKLAVVVLFVGLMLGCVDEVTQEGTDENDTIHYDVVSCRNITYERYVCQMVDFNYSAGEVRLLDPYQMDVFCVGGASVTVKNLEERSGEFTVTFVFSAPIEGKIEKNSTMRIASEEEMTFEERFHFRCSQIYDAEFRVTPPGKEMCWHVNKTREECLVK
ncbi:MAG: hypothetical protein ABIG39_02270 [Candidatus Micrarchaeota archaeon]